MTDQPTPEALVTMQDLVDRQKAAGIACLDERMLRILRWRLNYALDSLIYPAFADWHKGKDVVGGKLVRTKGKPTA